MSAYSDMAEAQKVYLSSQYIVVADIETTGFSGQYDDILEIGAVLLDLKNRALVRGTHGKVVRFSTYVKPQNRKTVPPKITELTGITDEMAQSGMSRNEAAELFYQFIQSYPVAFHNAAFDWDRFLSRDLLAAGRKPANPIVCTVELAKYLYPERKRYNLAEMCEQFGTVIEGHHRAWVDCTYTAALLLHMLDDLEAKVGESGQQLTMPTVPAPVTVEPESVRVRQVHRWKKGGHDRIYVTTNIGSLFYDLKKQTWAFKSLGRCQIRINDCVQAVLNQLGATEAELPDRFPAVKR